MPLSEGPELPSRNEFPIRDKGIEEFRKLPYDVQQAFIRHFADRQILKNALVASARGDEDLAKEYLQKGVECMNGRDRDVRKLKDAAGLFEERKQAEEGFRRRVSETLAQGRKKKKQPPSSEQK